MALMEHEYRGPTGDDFRYFQKGGGSGSLLSPRCRFDREGWFAIFTTDSRTEFSITRRSAHRLPADHRLWELFDDVLENGVSPEPFLDMLRETLPESEPAVEALLWH